MLFICLCISPVLIRPFLGLFRPSPQPQTHHLACFIPYSVITGTSLASIKRFFTRRRSRLDPMGQGRQITGIGPNHAPSDLPACTAALQDRLQGTSTTVLYSRRLPPNREEQTGGPPTQSSRNSSHRLSISLLLFSPSPSHPSLEIPRFSLSFHPSRSHL